MTEKKPNLFLIILAGIVGNTLEWYDFLLYAYFAPIIAPLFFPASTPFASLMTAFGVFALGFGARPIGALVIGRWGDIYGRKKVLIITLMLMTLPTMAIGILPSYQTIGIAAPLLLMLIRLLQGFAVSGELTSSANFLIEHFIPARRGFAGALINASLFTGILLGAAVTTIQAQLTPPEILHAWAWRIPFLLSGVFGVIGLGLRLAVMESPHFVAIKNHKQSTLGQLWQHHRVNVLRAVGLSVAAGIANYFLIVYFNTYLTQSGMLLKETMLINVISMLVFVILMPLFGLLSDIVGRKSLFLLGIAALFIGLTPIFWLFAQKTFFYALAGEILFAMLLSISNGALLTYLAELFPTAVRNSGTALGYNLAITLFGGTTPLIALYLVKLTHSDFAPAWFLKAGLVVTFLTAAFHKQTKKNF